MSPRRIPTVLSIAGSDPSVRKALDAYRKKQTASVPERPF